MRALPILTACLMALMMAAGPAVADRFRLQPSDGPSFLELQPDGTVQGHYPQKQGRIDGRVEGDGSIRGTWLQPRSDHPCEESRNGTHGWGYCGEQPRRDWDIWRE